MESLCAWLQALGLERYASLFSAHDVDLAVLCLLTDADLEKLGVSFGHRKKLLKAIAELNVGAPPALTAEANTGKPVPRALVGADGERRQLTVLFCDLVGYTELASRLDPEKLRSIIRSYEDACAAAITRYEGYVFQRLGDGIVAFLAFRLRTRARPSEPFAPASKFSPR